MGKAGLMIVPACRHEATKRHGIWGSNRDVRAGLGIGKQIVLEYPSRLAGGRLALRYRGRSRSELGTGWRLRAPRKWVP